MNKISILILATTMAFSPLALAGTDGDRCERHGGKHMQDADKNGDGFIDKNEARAMQEKHFDEMDANHDGKLSKDEMMACKRDGKKGGMHNKGSHEFMGADKDNDGTLDREEAKKLPRVFKNFDAIDTDKDGTVDRDEVHNFMQDYKGK